MKRSFLFVAFMLAVATLSAQVTVRNDIVLSGNHRRWKNRGITFISFNLNRSASWNYLVNGRGGNVMTVDVDALRRKKKTYTYSELAQRIYVPQVSTPPAIHLVPVFLLMPPPKIVVPSHCHRH